MGHDISGYNKKGEEIAYARFSMGNRNAIILYNLLESVTSYAGVSGSGRSSTFSKQQMEKSLQACKQFFNKNAASFSGNEFLEWDQKQIQTFIQGCLETAQKEGVVRVYFG
ncbi:hypothetical protein ACQYAD_01495 [Neobacillus sp. SM06]|uniref:hypothetical protein n=1 Tax=Neobacillus sp. SM06 TaxID=3422492 RepID=UPI003D2D1FCD